VVDSSAVVEYAVGRGPKYELLKKIEEASDDNKMARWARIVVCIVRRREYH